MRYCKPDRELSDASRTQQVQSAIEKGQAVSVDFLKMNTVEKAVESYLGTLEDADAARLRFFKGLWDVQDSLTGLAAPYAVPSRDEATEALRAAEAVFARYVPSVELEAYLEAVSQVRDYVVQAAGLGEEQVQALREADFGAAVTAESLSKAPYAIDEFLSETYDALIGPDGSAADEGADTSTDAPSTHGDDTDAEAAVVEPAVFALVAVAALSPLIAGAAVDARAAFDAKVLGQVTPQHCPVCGSAAAMSFVGERSSLQGGDRKLWCGLCHTSWPYGRVRCARCGNRSSTSLRYSHTEDDPGHRVHLCDQCHGYIRTVFSDEVNRTISPVVEDVVTSHLHEVAAQLGYSPAGDGVKRDVTAEPEYPEGVDLDGTF